jgi:acyl transferase domain-containing protein
MPEILRHSALAGGSPAVGQSQSGFAFSRAAFSDAVWLFPGIGCRHVGMGHDIIRRFPAADRLIAQADEHLGYDVVEVCLEGSGRKHVSARQDAQVIYVLECAYGTVLKELGYQPRAVSGHSLGNAPAAWACGAYDFITGLDLVTRVEDLLIELYEGTGQAMGVIVGLQEPEIQSLLGVSPNACLANRNAPGQYVIGGTTEGVDAVLAGAIAKGAKQARRFAGGWALHTPYMQELAARFRVRLASVNWSEPHIPFVSSIDCGVLTRAEEICGFLGEFLTRPVNWEPTMRALRQSWGNAFVEVGPGNLLSKMSLFIDRTAAIRTASEILELRAG